MVLSKWFAASIPKGPVRLMYRVYKYALPEVDAQLKGWQAMAGDIPDPELRKQALASIAAKRFHCEGGSVYAVAHLAQRHVLIPLIVALQTISDYLDNLCDRSTSLDADDFRMLHQSMLDAVDPGSPRRDYYAFRSEKDDGGYLESLVKTCQSCLMLLPSYSLVKNDVIQFVGLYRDLQVYKHIRCELREPALFHWWEKHQPEYPDLLWNEFAAATGSTLGMFTLFLAASYSDLGQDEAERMKQAYFPYICGIHILLDYLIDQEEDQAGGDLNFCSYYENPSQTAERLAHMMNESKRAVRILPEPRFHRMIIEGLFALYLSDPKAKEQAPVRAVTRTLMRGSPLMRLFFWMNSMVIRRKQQQITLSP